MLSALRFADYRTGEVTLADELWRELPDNSLTIVDRNFPVADHLNSRREAAVHGSSARGVQSLSAWQQDAPRHVGILPRSRDGYATNHRPSVWVEIHAVIWWYPPRAALRRSGIDGSQLN